MSLIKRTAPAVVPTPAPAEQPVTFPYVAIDQNGRTCLALSKERHGIRCVPMDAGGLQLTVWPSESRTKLVDGVEVTVRAGFDAVYKPLPNYELAKGAAIYLQVAKQSGAQGRVVDELAKLIPISDEDRELIQSKNKVVNIQPKAAAPAATKEKKPMEKKEPRESAAAMFKELIMAGNLSDDKIFERVQDKFNLDPKKRSYVAWYRNDLSKKGMNPPAPVGGAAKKDTAKGKKPGKKAAKTSKKKATKKK
jgi:hypothetical protein